MFKIIKTKDTEKLVPTDSFFTLFFYLSDHEKEEILDIVSSDEEEFATVLKSHFRKSMLYTDVFAYIYVLKSKDVF